MQGLCLILGLLIMDIKLMICNCQGDANPRLDDVVHEYCRDYNPKVIMLMETWVSGKTADTVITKLDFSYSHRVEQGALLEEYR